MGPTRHLKHLLFVEEVPDWEAGEIRRGSPADIARLDAVKLGLCQVNFDFYLGFKWLRIDM